VLDGGASMDGLLTGKCMTGGPPRVPTVRANEGCDVRGGHCGTGVDGGGLDGTGSTSSQEVVREDVGVSTCRQQLSVLLRSSGRIAHSCPCCPNAPDDDVRGSTECDYGYGHACAMRTVGRPAVGGRALLPSDVALCKGAISQLKILSDLDS
jgi:hypothetical protein